MIFDTISVKALWERRCRWNCDLRVINARKKGILCLTGRRNWYFARETHKDTAVSVWACQAGFWKSTGTSCQLRSKPHAVFHGVCEIALTEVLATQMGVMRRSKKVSSFDLYKLNPLSPHCGSIARELVHCYTWGLCELLQFAATQ